MNVEFITLCYPELKLQFVLPLYSMHFVSHYECSRKGTNLSFSFYGSVFLMIVRLADNYFLSLSTLRAWHTTKTMTVLQKVDT
jgi:hypothetical protein